MTGNGGTPSQDRLDDTSDPDFENVLGSYLDRLTEGDFLDPEEVRAAYPRFRDALLEHLAAFVEVAEAKAPNVLGTLGDYTLRRQIGRGGMGVVYEAWQNSMDRQVALKVLPVGIAADTKACARFMREAQTAGKLNHQNIVGVHSTGVEEGTPWYSMEYVEGETLAQVGARLKHAQPDTETRFGPKDQGDYFIRLARAFADVADGLQHAHSRGVVHRDIKPSNLILDGEGKLRILDFGLAHLEGQESLTISGDVVGTPQYMSPEQARRKKIPIDHRTDVYSLGATMYEALCGRPPFQGTDHADTLSHIIERDPVEPRKLNPRVPSDLQTIALKCLSKEAVNRYGTAEALAQDLRRLVRGDPIEARPERRPQRLWRCVRRQRQRLTFFVVLLTFLAALLWLVHARNRAEHAMQEATYERDVLLAAGSIFFHELRVGERLIRSRDPPGLLITPGLKQSIAVSGEESVGAAVRHLQEIVRTLPEGRDAHYYLARGFRALGREQEAVQELNQALNVDRNFTPATLLIRELEVKSGVAGRADDGVVEVDPDDTTSWQRWWLVAHRSLWQQNWREVARAYAQLIALRKAMQVDPYIGFSLEAYLGHGAALLELGDFERAEDSFAMASSLEPGSQEPYLLLAKAHFLDGDKPRADEIFQMVYDDVTLQFAQNDRSLAIALIYSDLRDFESAVRWAKKLDHPLSGKLSAFFFLRLGKITQAIGAGQQTLAEYPDDASSSLLLAVATLEDCWRRPVGSRWSRLAELFPIASRATELNSGNSLAETLLKCARQELGHDLGHCFRRIAMTFKATRFGSGLVGLIVSVVPWMWAQDPPFRQPEPIGEINTGENELMGSLSPDGQTLYFQRGIGVVDGYSDIYISKRGENGRFGTPVKLFAGASPRISADELSLYFVAGPGGGDIFVAIRESREDDFEEVLALDSVNTEFLEWEPSVSADELTIIFVSDRPDSAGLDLWMATRDRKFDGIGNPAPFGPAKNLDAVNSGSDDAFPNLATDGRTLFFNSDRPGSKGLHDLWMATLSPDGQFETVTHVGALSTAAWEFSPFVSFKWPAPGSKFYFSRGSVQADIYESVWDPSFLRGDCNDDSDINVADVSCALNWLFAGGAAPGCLAALNTNGDDAVDLADPVWLLNFLFGGGPIIADPFPHCGPSMLPADAELDCANPPSTCQ